MTELREFEAQLKEPFALDDIDFLPKKTIEREGKTLCMALPYADPRVYQDRLNAIAYGEWSTPAPVVVVAGNKLICYVTVVLCGIPHTDVGEATNNEENTGTEAWAQAFKRACSQFGLGRYLYNLEKEWVPFNPQRKVIDLDPAQKQAVVKKMYQKAGIVLAGSNGQALHKLAAPGSYESHHGEALITDQQKASIRKLYEHLGREMGEDVATMTYQQAKDAILVLSGEYNKMRERPAPAEPQESAHHDLPTLRELQTRCNRVIGSGMWQTMLHKALKIEDDELVLQEDDLTPGDREYAAAYMDFVEEQRKKAKAGK